MAERACVVSGLGVTNHSEARLWHGSAGGNEEGPKGEERRGWEGQEGRVSLHTYRQVSFDAGAPG